MAGPAVGDVVPRVVVMTTDGDPVYLSDYYDQGPVVLGFLRHFG